MRKQEKRRILLLLLLLLVVVIVKISIGGKQEVNDNEGREIVREKNTAEKDEYVEVLKDGTRINKSENLKQVKTLGVLEFSNIQLSNKNGQSVLLADVKNMGSTATEMQLVDVIILGKNGEQLTKVIGAVAPLEGGESSQLNISMTMDYSNAYDFKIEARTK